MFGIGKRRCSKGKPCGFTCIDRDKECLLGLPRKIKDGLRKVAQKIGIRKKPQPPAALPMSGSKDPDTIDAKGRINLALTAAEKDPKARKVDGLVKEGSLNWRSATGSGVNFVGGGEFGAFVTVPSDKLSPGLEKRFPGGVGVKGGQIGPEEAEALRIAGRNGMGPQLIGGRTTESLERDKYGYYSYNGVLAMSKVPGTPFYKVGGAVNGVVPADAYWTAAARLHRLGIAHNDMHGGNLLIDGKGVGRFVDFGLAQVNPKAAAAEAIGAFYGGNWQFMQLNLGNSRSEARIRGNIGEVGKILAKAGFTMSDLQEVMSTEIRSPNGFYEKGAWGKLSNDDAMRIIKALYKGIT